MSLSGKLTKCWRLLSQYKSYIPFLILPPFFLFAMKESVYLENLVGDGLEDVWVLVCFCISLIGLGIRAFTVGHLPDKTTQNGIRPLNTTGMYSIVRNPLYLGSFIIILGLLLCIKVWWLVLLGTFAYFLYVEYAILGEEKKFTENYGQTYVAWREKTPVILPNFSLWQKPDLSFSWKMVLKREYPALLAIGTTFFITEIVTDLVFENDTFANWFAEDIVWPITFAVILIIGVTLHYLKNHTTMLKVEGR